MKLSVKTVYCLKIYKKKIHKSTLKINNLTKSQILFGQCYIINYITSQVVYIKTIHEIVENKQNNGKKTCLAKRKLK